MRRSVWGFAIFFGANIAFAAPVGQWTMLDEILDGPWSTTQGATVAQNGDIFTSVSAGWNSSHPRALVRRSQDGGISWTTVLDVNQLKYCDGLDVLMTSTDRLFVATTCEGLGWVIYSSRDHGQSWRATNQYLAPPGFYAWGGGRLHEGPNSTILMTSMFQTNYASRNWIVRTGSVDGFNWKDDDLGYGMGYDITANQNHDLFVVGEQDHPEQGVNARHWMVKRKSSGSSVWQDTDDFLGSSNANIATAWSIAIDPNGVIFVGGSVFHDSPTALDWVIRRSADNGSTWQTFDLISGAAWDWYEVRALAVDSQGRLVAAGYGNGANGMLVKRWTPSTGNIEIFDLDANVSIYKMQIDSQDRILLSGWQDIGEARVGVTKRLD